MLYGLILDLREILKGVILVIIKGATDLKDFALDNFDLVKAEHK